MHCADRGYSTTVSNRSVRNSLKTKHGAVCYSTMNRVSTRDRHDDVLDGLPAIPQQSVQRSSARAMVSECKLWAAKNDKGAFFADQK